MPIISPDLSQVGPLEPGTYKAKITKVEARTSKNGNPMIVPTFEIEVPGRDDPATRQSFLVITGSGAYGFSQLLRACGLAELADQYEDPEQPNPPFDTDELEGSVLQLVLEEDTYEDQKRDKIRAYLRN